MIDLDSEISSPTQRPVEIASSPSLEDAQNFFQRYKGALKEISADETAAGQDLPKEPELGSNPS